MNKPRYRYNHKTKEWDYILVWPIYSHMTNHKYMTAQRLKNFLSSKALDKITISKRPFNVS